MSTTEQTSRRYFTLCERAMRAEPEYAAAREAFEEAVERGGYTRREAVYVQWQADHLLITSPGGFPEGITVGNILVHEPKPRNPRLAEAFGELALSSRPDAVWIRSTWTS
jgi:predicted HTH transcriptional regulator